MRCELAGVVERLRPRPRDRVAAAAAFPATFAFFSAASRRAHARYETLTPLTSHVTSQTKITINRRSRPRLRRQLLRRNEDLVGGRDTRLAHFYF